LHGAGARLADDLTERHRLRRKTGGPRQPYRRARGQFDSYSQYHIIPVQPLDAYKDTYYFLNKQFHSPPKAKLYSYVSHPFRK
jgi:hypothetical protein